MNAALIRNYLLRRPKPEGLRLTTGDHQEFLDIAKGSSWASLAESIEAIDPDLIEVLDKSGKLIRAVKRETLEQQAEETAETSPTSASPNSKHVVDGETARFKEFSFHLAEAYKFATGVAFERMVSLFEAVNRRSESLEKSLEATHRLLGKAYQEQVDLALENAQQDGDQDPVAGLVTAFMGGATQAAAEKAGLRANGKAAPQNGKAKA
jgi:hypothetical protein